MVGGGLVGLSTAIIIQENVPNVHVELLDDFGLTTTLLDRANSKAMKGFRISSPSEKIGNRSAGILRLEFIRGCVLNNFFISFSL